jgi:putative transposase
MLPGEFAPWQTVYYYFRKWKEQGVIERILDFVRRRVRTEEAGCEPTPSAVMIDCQSVPTTRVGGCSGFDGHKKVKGRKRHVIVDTEGLIGEALTWEASVHAANEHESQRAFEMIASVFQKSNRLEVFLPEAFWTVDRRIHHLAEQVAKALFFAERKGKVPASHEPVPTGPMRLTGYKKEV